MSLNDDVVDIEKPDVIYLLAFVVADFSRLYLHGTIYSFKDSKS